jgi:benzaldehyde dehydrogenase (NAD)
MALMDEAVWRGKIFSGGWVAAGAKLAAGGSYEGLPYSPTVLAEVSEQMPAYASEVFGPVAPVLRFSSARDAAKLAAQSEYGLSFSR